jgi:hypothetical protein
MAAEPPILRRIAWWAKGEPGVCIYYKQLRPGCSYHTRDLSMPLADLTILQKRKQNFQLQYSVGDNQNAIKIQIWCALIAVLLLSVIHHQNSPKLAFSNVITLLRIHLTGYISIAGLLALHCKPRKRPNDYARSMTRLLG